MCKKVCPRKHGPTTFFTIVPRSYKSCYYGEWRRRIALSFQLGCIKPFRPLKLHLPANTPSRNSVLRFLPFKVSCWSLSLRILSFTRISCSPRIFCVILYTFSGCLCFKCSFKRFHSVTLSMYKYFYIIFKYRFIYHLRLRCLIKFEDFWNIKNGKNLENFKILHYSLVWSLIWFKLLYYSDILIYAKSCKFIKSDVYIETDLDFIDRFYLRCRLVS